jgi:pilus assembly protein CpaB
MRTRSIMLLALALACGLVASIGISQFMDKSGQTPEGGERQPVFVAMNDIGPNQELTAQNIKLEEWPRKIVPQGALTKLEEVEGQRTRTKLYAGEPILASKLLGANDLTGAAKDIPPGYRVAHVKVDPVTGASNLILPGDRVDVIVFRHPKANQNATAAKIILQDIKVFAVDTHTETEYTTSKDEQSESMTAKTISLLVKPHQAVILHAATEIGGAVRLVLRNPEDNAHVATKGATIEDIFGNDTDRSDRDAEQATDAETGEITNWLTNQNGKSQIGASSPLPATPGMPMGRKRMLVMLGAELVQIEIPGQGELPIIHAESGQADLGGDQSSFDAAGGAGIAQPPGDESKPAEPDMPNEMNESQEN